LASRTVTISTALDSSNIASIVDLMRYAALNQGGDDLASFDGFIPADIPSLKNLPDPASQSRYSEQQLYALALYARRHHHAHPLTGEVL
jgi:hypothetical protein